MNKFFVEILRMVKVMFPYQPANEDELKLEPGDIVSVIADVSLI